MNEDLTTMAVNQKTNAIDLYNKEIMTVRGKGKYTYR